MTELEPPLFLIEPEPSHLEKFKKYEVFENPNFADTTGAGLEPEAEPEPLTNLKPGAGAGTAPKNGRLRTPSFMYAEMECLFRLCR